MDDEVEVVVAHSERATLRVGDVYLKVDADRARVDVEVQAMALAPVPTPDVLWHKPPVLALAALRGTTLGRLGGPSTGTSAAWMAAGAAIRQLHEAPLPSWTGRAWPEHRHAGGGTRPGVPVAGGEGTVARRAGHPQSAGGRGRVPGVDPAFTHGDLQIAHVFLDGDEVTGVIDWSEAGQGDPLYDLATFSLGHEERLGDLLAGYGGHVDLEVVRAWWALRSLLAVRWLSEHGFDPFAPGCEVDVLKSRM